MAVPEIVVTKLQATAFVRLVSLLSLSPAASRVAGYVWGDETVLRHWSDEPVEHAKLNQEKLAKNFVDTTPPG